MLYVLGKIQTILWEECFLKFLLHLVFEIHCGKKIGDAQIICRTLRGSGCLIVANPEFLVGQSKMFKRWNKQQPPKSIQLIQFFSVFFFDLKKVFSWLQAEIRIHVGSNE